MRERKRWSYGFKSWCNQTPRRFSFTNKPNEQHRMNESAEGKRKINSTHVTANKWSKLMTEASTKCACFTFFCIWVRWGHMLKHFRSTVSGICKNVCIIPPSYNSNNHHVYERFSENYNFCYKNTWEKSIVGKSLKLEMGWIMVANTKPQKLGEYFGIEFQQEIR